MKRIILSTTLICSNILYAGFNFGECSGSGTFSQHIDAYGGDKEKAVTVGTIPKGIQGLEVKLVSESDIDIRLYGSNNDKIVHWPDGILKGSTEETGQYKGTDITYSGFNGVAGKKGHEFIKVDGSTPTIMTMKAFGYKDGDAKVEYTWTGKEGCEVGHIGEGGFYQEIPSKDVAVVGDIPKDIDYLYIRLDSDKDLDIQLYGEDGTAIVSYTDGILRGATKQTTTYNGMNIEWSGYDGTNGKKGNEYIKILGKTTEKVTMKVYGYEAGKATVEYTWGDSSGTCITKGRLKNKISAGEDVTSVNTSCITDMSELFHWGTKDAHFTQDISGWDVSNVTNMDSMFMAADAGPMNAYYNPKGIGEWNVSNVTSMAHMFEGDVEFNQDISKWDVSKVTNMNGMFQFSHKFNQDVSEWNVSNVVDYKYFSDGSALDSQYNPFIKINKPRVISISNESGKERSIIKHTILLSEKTTSTVYYNVDTKGITAGRTNCTAGGGKKACPSYPGDYSRFLSNSTHKKIYDTVKVPAGVNSFEIYVQTLQDDISEENETYELIIGEVHGTGTIIDVTP